MAKRFVMLFVDAALCTAIDIANGDRKGMERSCHPSFCVDVNGPFMMLQNHRIVEVGGVLMRSSTSTPPLSHLEQVAQELVWLGLEYLQGWKLHAGMLGVSKAL